MAFASRLTKRGCSFLRRPFGKRAEFFDKSGSQVVEAEGFKRGGRGFTNSS
jgi:hypothetical protein